MGHQSDRKTKKELRKFKARYRIQAPIVIDEADMLAKRLKAAITPEVFLVDASGNILYRGAIDNWFYALGKNRPSATEHFLEDAIQDILQGKDVRKPVTQAIGCYLEYKD